MKANLRSTPTEKQIENAILEYLSYIPDGMFWKNQSVGVWDATRNSYRLSRSKFQIKGTADILGVMKGVFVAIEVKRPGGKVSEDQLRFIERVNKLGGVAFIAHSVVDVKNGLSYFFPN